MPTMNTCPPWLRKRVTCDDAVFETAAVLKEAGVRTVCGASLCPNANECFSKRHAAFLILGDVCTRGCSFCAASKGRPLAPEAGEPDRIVKAIVRLGMRRAVITAVTRDDLDWGGALEFADVIKRIRTFSATVEIEVLVPDFAGRRAAIRHVAAASPDVLGHNIETVPRLYGKVRRGADYARSLDVLECAKEANPSVSTKSAILLGLGEERDEVVGCMRDLLGAGCEALVMGQYLRPSRAALPVKKYLSPDEFSWYRHKARELGFGQVLSSPFARSSCDMNETPAR